MLTTKLNAAQADAVNPAMLCDRFIDGLHPPSLRRDIRRYAREHADVTFHQARAEAQRWMREDADVEVRAEQVLVAQPQHNKASGGAAGPSSGSDGEDSRAAG